MRPLDRDARCGSSLSGGVVQKSWQRYDLHVVRTAFPGSDFEALGFIGDALRHKLISATSPPSTRGYGGRWRSRDGPTAPADRDHPHSGRPNSTPGGSCGFMSLGEKWSRRAGGRGLERFRWVVPGTIRYIAPMGWVLPPIGTPAQPHGLSLSDWGLPLLDKCR
jgi:hypothetical protein